MSRPYFNSGIADLEKLFEENLINIPILRELQNELIHRSTNRANLLFKKVEQALETANDSDGRTNPSVNTSPENHPDLFDQKANPPNPPANQPITEPKKPVIRTPETTTGDDESISEAPDDRRRPIVFKTISAPGCSGKPDAWTPQLKTDLDLVFPSGASNCKRFAIALDALVTEMKREGSGQNRHELKNGKLITGGGSQNLYSFVFASDADVFEDAVIEIEVTGRRASGHIASIADGRILLALDDNLGPAIQSCILLIDNTAIIDALKEKLLQAENGDLVISKELADNVISREKTVRKVDTMALPAHNLNPSKNPALLAMSSNQITYLWGPPGTGKTETLAVIIEAAFDSGKRVLICSNTNQAVDQLIYKLAKRLRDNKNSALDEGRIVRPGNIVLPELVGEFSVFVTIEGIAKRLGEELAHRKQELQDNIARIDTRLDPIEKILVLFAALDKKKEEKLILEKESSGAATELSRLAKSRNQLENKISVLDFELKKFDAAGTLHRVILRSRPTITADITETQRRLDNQKDLLEKQLSVVEELKSRLSVIDQSISDSERKLSGKDRNDLLREQESLNEKHREVVAELRIIEHKLAEIEASIIKDAKVVGTTIARSYLRAKDLGQFDLVVIDEASMVLLPALYFATGMSRERVIISGDFRQLPPILPSKQQAIHDVIGDDVFAKAGINSADKDPRRQMLTVQYRMINSICKLVSDDMYDGKLITAEDRKSADNHLAPKPFDSNLTIIDTSKLWPFESQNVFKSRFNLLNALLVRNLVEYLDKQGFIKDSSSLGVCSPYAAQASLLRKLLDNEDNSNSLVSAGTVHRYQGDEKYMMILDIPESIGPAWGIGLFVQGVPPENVGARLLNVAISRAREFIVIVANLTYLEDKLPSTALLRSILHNIQAQGRVIDASDVLELHPIHSDLKDLMGIVELDLEAEKFGLFHQHSFSTACLQDIRNANESIVIYSGFVTPERIASYGDLFRLKLSEGVKIRCVTRPPHLNGSMSSELGKQALDALEGMGVIVDCRDKIHEKIVIIDTNITWAGSLNPLSHTAHTDEFMTRTVNQGYAEQVSIFLSKRSGVKISEIASMATEAENPRCPECESRTSFALGRFGPYYTCENLVMCGWKGSAKNAFAAKSDGVESQHSETGPACPECKSVTKLRKGRYGPFYGCSNYPKCKGIVKISRKRRAES